VYHNHHPKLIL